MAIRRRHEGDPGVRFYAVPRAELWRRVTRARAVLCPVDIEESHGLVAAEARATGTPVVAIRPGALGEVVDHEVTGFLVQPGDIGQAVAAAVRSVTRSTAAVPAACRRASRPCDVPGRPRGALPSLRRGPSPWNVAALIDE